MSYTPTIDRAAILAANPGIRSSAQWFWWIVGLSVVNSAMIHSGSDTSFSVGLGITLLVDLVFRATLPVALIADVLALGFFGVMGLFASKGRRWAFLVGGIAYALDSLFFLFAKDFFGLAIHGWALFSIWTGGMLLHRSIRKAQEEAGNAAVEASPAATPPTTSTAPQDPA